MIVSESLEQLEAEVEDSFVRSGQALKKIRDGKKYPQDDWAGYLRARWDMDIRQAQRLIKAAEVVDELADQETRPDRSPFKILPQTEFVAREVAKAPVERRADVWEEATHIAAKDAVAAGKSPETARPSATQTERARRAVLKTPKPAPKSKVKPKGKPARPKRAKFIQPTTERPEFLRVQGPLYEASVSLMSYANRFAEVEVTESERGQLNAKLEEIERKVRDCMTLTARNFGAEVDDFLREMQ